MAPSSSGVQAPPSQKQQQYPLRHPIRNARKVGNGTETPATSSNDWEDAQTIARLENECSRLSSTMSNVRKYTQEWFLLDRKLKNATQELEAAKEDRDLHYHFCGSTPKSEACVPVTVISGVSDEKQLSFPELNSKHIVNPNATDQGNFAPKQNDERELEIPLEHDRIERELQVVLKFSPEWFALKEELMELSISLDHDEKGKENQCAPGDKPKETEFAKQSTSTLSSSTDVGIARCQSSLAGSKEKRANHRKRGRSTGRGTKTISSQEMQQQQQHDNHYSTPTSPIRFRPVVPRSTSPIPAKGTFSPYHQSTGSNSNSSSSSFNAQINHCLPPYLSNSSPNCSASASLPKGSVSQNYQEILPHEELSYDGGDSNSNVDKSTLQGDEHAKTLFLLKAQHSKASEELNSLPQFSREWFDVKSRKLKLDDQISELESTSSHSSSIDHDDPKNNSFLSGWSSVWSESEEEEIMSFADDLECIMVAEALALKRQQVPVSPSEAPHDCEPYHHHHRDHSDMQKQKQAGLYLMDHPSLEQKHILHLQAWLRGRLQYQKYTKLRKNAVIIQSMVRRAHTVSRFRQILQKATLIQSWLRKSLAMSRFKLLQKQQKPKKRKTKEHKSDQQEAKYHFDSMLDEFALLLGDSKVDDREESKEYYATLIQERWRGHVACRTLMRLKRRAVLYWSLVKYDGRQAQLRQSQKKESLWRHIQVPKTSIEMLKENSHWQIFAAILTQAIWRRHRVRKHYCYAKICIIKIQSLIRCGICRLEFIQVCKEQAALNNLKEVSTSTIIIQRSWRRQHLAKKATAKGLLDECLFVKTQIHYLVSELEKRHRSLIVIQSNVRLWMLGECEDLLLKLKSLQAAIIIQSYARRWQDRRQYMQTLRQIALIQDERREEVPKPSIQLNQIKTRASSGNLNLSPERHCVMKEIQSSDHAENTCFPSEECVDPPMNFRLLCNQFENESSTVRLQRVEIESIAKNQARGDSSQSLSDIDNEHFSSAKQISQDIGATVYCDVRTDETSPIAGHGHLRCVAGHIQNMENNFLLMNNILSQNRQERPLQSLESLHGNPSSVAGLRQNLEADSYISNGPKKSPLIETSLSPSVSLLRHDLEAIATTPIFPPNNVKSAKTTISVDLADETEVSPAQICESWSPESEVFDKKIVAQSMQSKSSARTTRSMTRKKKKCTLKMNKTLTTEEKMKSLSTECFVLSQRMCSLPKFSPEWTLSKIEMKLITEEMDFLYKESLNKRRQFNVMCDETESNG